MNAPHDTNDPVDTRRLLDHLQVGLVLYSESGHVLDMNRYARLMLKIHDEVGGRLIDEILPAEVITELPNLHGRMKRSLGGSAKQTVVVRGDDETAHWEVTLSRSAATEAADLYVMMVDDVTELAEYEHLQRRAEALERMNLAANEANRLKTEFLANMSHELRTPLNSIIGFAELMASGKVGEPSDPHKEFLGDILTSGRHLLQLINDVLDLSKVEAGRMDFNPEATDMPGLVDEVTSILREQAAKKQVRIHHHVADDAARAMLDPLRTKQILYNYLSNAVKFTHPGDEVHVEVRTSEGSIRIDVLDHGPGIAEEDRDLLFREFEQLDRSAKKTAQGTGLGLALTRRLAEAQGGQVGVESRPGAGSRFWVEVPQSEEARSAAEVRRRSEGPRMAPVDPTARVLVVEDEPEERTHIVRALDAEGYHVEAAGTAGDALQKVRTRRYDAMVLDLLLPDGRGEEVLAALRTEGAQRQTPVIIASVVEPEGAVLGFPVADFLSKPFQGAELVAALRRAGVPPERPVLIVDDDPGVRRLVIHHLQDLGHPAQGAADGAEALAVAERHRPGLVVLDLLMPGMDGFVFLERFRDTEAGRDIPVIVWTTRELSRDERLFLQRSAQRVVQKGDGGRQTLAHVLADTLGTRRQKERARQEVTP